MHVLVMIVRCTCIPSLTWGFSPLFAAFFLASWRTLPSADIATWLRRRYGMHEAISQTGGEGFEQIRETDAKMNVVHNACTESMNSSIHKTNANFDVVL